MRCGTKGKSPFKWLITINIKIKINFNSTVKEFLLDMSNKWDMVLDKTKGGNEVGGGGKVQTNNYFSY